MTGTPAHAKRRGGGIASQTSLVLASRVFGALSTGVLMAILTRSLGKEGYGEYAFAMMIVSLAAVFASLGIEPSTGRYVADAHNRGKSIRQVVLTSLRLRTILGFGLLVALIIFAPLLDSIREGNQTGAIRVAAFALLGSFLFAWVTSIVEGVQDGQNLASLSLVKSVVEFITVIALLWTGAGVLGAIAGNAIGYGASILVGAYILRRYLRRTPDVAPQPGDHVSSRAIVNYGLHVWAAGIAWMLFDKIDLALITLMLEKDALPLYDAAWRIATILGLLGITIASTVPPRIAAQPPEVASRVLVNALRVALIFYIVVGAVTAVAAPVGAPLVLGHEFEESGLLIQVLVPYIALVGIAPILARSLDYIGGSQIRKWIALASLVVNVVLDLILIPALGLIGPAIATNIAIAVFVAGHYWAVVRHMPLDGRALARTAGRALAGGALGALTCWVMLQLPGPAILVVAAASVMALVVAGLTILALGESQRRTLPLPRPVQGLVGRVSDSPLRLPSPSASVILLGAILVGLITGKSPLIALGLAIGLAFVVLLLADITTGVIAFILIQPFGMLLGAGETLISKGGGVLLLVTWLVSLRYPATRNRYARFLQTSPALGLLMFAFVGWTAASLLWTINRAGTIDAVQRYALGFVLLIIVFTAAWNRSALRRMCGAYAISVGACALLGLGLGRFLEGRFIGTFQDANEWAAFCIPGLVLAVGMIAVSRQALHQLAFGACAALAAVSIVLSGSRGGIIGIVLALAVWVAFGGRWRWRVLAAGLTVAVLGAGYVSVAASPATRERLLSITQGQQYGTSEGTGRADIWQVGLRVYEDHPVLGTGAGTFVNATPRYLAQPGLLRRVDFFTVRPKVAHNMYLHVAAELGAVGIALYVAVLALCVAATLRAARIFRILGDAGTEFLCRTMAAGAVGFLSANFFISGQYARDLWILMGICMGMLGLAHRRRAAALAASRAVTPRIVGEAPATPVRPVGVPRAGRA